MPIRKWIPAFAGKTERRRHGGKRLHTTTSYKRLRHQHSGFTVPDSSLAGDPPQAVYVDLRDALLASTGNSELLLKFAIGNSARGNNAA